MIEYVKVYWGKITFKIGGRNATPWTGNLFMIDEGSIKERNIPHIGDEEYDFV